MSVDITSYPRWSVLEGQVRKAVQGMATVKVDTHARTITTVQPVDNEEDHTMSVVSTPRRSIMAHGIRYIASRVAARSWSLFDVSGNIVFDSIATFDDCVEHALADAEWINQLAEFGYAVVSRSEN